ncbi:phosphatase PAP2 family protein [Salinarchaeum sp. IM2453]|uniref:phosphatase PAP2 family protein n=1 Tax=Salinarchaeum sp. IM2453 TaxID=2862870 RepID=UPI001C834E12|nr:phosphatase PAP2 family protein [Salinarchaeum sp. IM2453]QZA88669.1 phosphatase PAP2 family protein [Salinarchaeum sp. IM2453]
MSNGDWHPVFEDAILETIVHGTPEAIGIVLTVLTHLGSVYVVVPAVILAYFWAPNRMATWIATVCGYYGLMGGIKSLNSADRPPIVADVSAEWFPGVFSWLHGHGAGITTTSFPSGNAMIATAIITLMIFDLRISTLRNRALVGAAVIGLVGYSRLALAVHYPIDVIGGIALGIILAGTVVSTRRHFDRGTLAVFAFAAALAFFGVWVHSNGFAVPAWEGILGSNRNIALGGAVGGMVTLYLGQRTDWQFNVSGKTTMPVFAGAGVLLSIAYAIHTSITHPLVTMLWAGVAFGIILIVPHLIRKETQRLTSAPQTHS